MKGISLTTSRLIQGFCPNPARVSWLYMLIETEYVNNLDN